MTSKCELWPVYVPENILVAIQGKRRTRIDAHQSYMVQKFYCPSCEQYFSSIDEYHIHRIMKLRQEIQEEEVQKAKHKLMKRMNNDLGSIDEEGTALGVNL